MSRNFFSILGALVLIGCGGGTPVNVIITAQHSIATAIEIDLDDAETALVLDIIRTEVHVAQGGNSAHGSSAWITLEGEQRSVDLLILEGTPSQIADGLVPDGRLTGIRLITSGGRLITGTTEERFTVPSGESSGLKLVIAPTIELGGDVEDVSLALTVEGLLDREHGELKLRPALRLEPVQ